MNKITILAAIASLSVAALPIYADDAHHPEKAQQAAPMPKAEATEKPAGTEQAADPQMGQAQETMRKLQHMMVRIRHAGNPKERRELMQEHMRIMQEGMKQLRGMGGSMMGMGGGGKQGGMMMGSGDKQGGGMMMGDMMKAHDMMEMRMEMMEMLMDHMMQHEEMRDAMQPK